MPEELVDSMSLYAVDGVISNRLRWSDLMLSASYSSSNRLKIYRHFRHRRNYFCSILLPPYVTQSMSEELCYMMHSIDLGLYFAVLFVPLFPFSALSMAFISTMCYKPPSLFSIFKSSVRM